MWKNLFIALLVLLLLIAWGEVRDVRYYKWVADHRIPECVEDAVLVGTGDYDGGVWEYYRCGPSFDDYMDVG